MSSMGSMGTHSVWAKIIAHKTVNTRYKKKQQQQQKIVYKSRKKNIQKQSNMRIENKINNKNEKTHTHAKQTNKLLNTA